MWNVIKLSNQLLFNVMVKGIWSVHRTMACLISMLGSKTQNQIAINQWNFIWECLDLFETICGKSTTLSSNTNDQRIERIIDKLCHVGCLCITKYLRSSSLCTFACMPSVTQHWLGMILYRGFVKNFFLRWWKILQTNLHVWHLVVCIV